MHIHILGICGTFMGGIAIIARQLGYTVTGSDANVYPPMSTQLEAQGITLMQGYLPEHLTPAPDIVVVGNAMARGNPAVEHMLNSNMRFMSGPAFLAEYVLKNRWVLGVSGTHGKTTTSGMLAWILEHNGMNPGFLVGGVPCNFGISARLGEDPFFVVEADEYDSAFFDKRSKFIHYGARTLIINNIEFDHGDIFDDLNAIKKQFHHLVRTVPGNGQIIYPDSDTNISAVLEQGCWTPVAAFGQGEWRAQAVKADYSRFTIEHKGKVLGEVTWSLLGKHNMDNGTAAIIAAHHAGIPVVNAIEALVRFENVKRRLEIRGVIDGVTVYDDFAHHPTAIATTLDGLRKKVDGARIIAVLEPRSNTMRLGVHRDTLAGSLGDADEVLMMQPGDIGWSLDEVAREVKVPARVFSNVDDIVKELVGMRKPGDHILIMSNGAFGGIHEKLLQKLHG